MPDCLLPSTDAPSVPIRGVVASERASLANALDRPTAAWVAANDFTAAAGSILLLPGNDGTLSSVLFGLGDPAADPRAQLLAGKLPAILPPGIYRFDSGFDDPAAASLAFALGAYRFTRYRGEKASPRLVMPGGIDAAAVMAIADGVYLARDLINTAPNDMGPAELAAAAKDLAERHGAEYSETVGGALLSANFPMIHAVGVAAAPSRAPRLILASVLASCGDPGLR